MKNYKFAEAYHKTRLGQILISRGYLSEERLQEAIAQQKNKVKPLGEMLLEEKIVSRWQLRRALSYQTRQRFASCLLISLLEPPLSNEGGDEGMTSVIPGEVEALRLRLMSDVRSSVSDQTSNKPLYYDSLQAKVEIKVGGDIQVKSMTSYGELVFSGIRLKGNVEEGFISPTLSNLELSDATVKVKTVFAGGDVSEAGFLRPFF